MPEQTHDMAVPGTSAPPPVPDLGFFAGAPAAGGSAVFGGGSQFGDTATFGSGPQPGAAAAPFGAPVAGAFGAPPPPPPADPSSAPTAWTPARVARRVGIPLVGLVVLGLFGFGGFGFLAGFLAGDLELPSTLQGLPASSDPTVTQSAQQLETDLEQRNSGDAVVGAYGAAPTILFVAGQRTRVDVTRELADSQVFGASKVGDNTCGTSTNQLSVCLRTSASTSIIVIGTLPVFQLSAAVDEVWEAQ